MIIEYKNKFLHFYEANESKFEVLFFLGGIVFDMLMLSEVDDPFAIIQQIVYLSGIFTLLYFEILFRLFKWKPGQKMLRFWAYRNLLLHFMLGTLLNVYSLFYIKSASILNSIIFLGVMVLVIFANELPGVKKSNMSVKVGMFGICLFSFFAVIFPLALGFIGWTPLILSMAATLGVFYFLYWLLHRIIQHPMVLFKTVLAPSFSVIGLFVVFSFMGWIPPVPLSVVEQGVYHNVEKDQGNYLLSTEKIWWKFWESGDQHFVARPGDKIFYYAQIYSPTRFSDEIFVQWSQKVKGNWKAADKIPLKIVGGRKLGFRGFTYKTNYQPGEWRVQILTSLGQEVSRMDLDVIPSTNTEQRAFEIIKR